MCGLAGLGAIGGGVLSEQAGLLLDRMSRAVGHRGPDGERQLREGPVGMAFRRLSLVGTTSGDQPLFSADRSVALIANGEVYNYREIQSGPLAGIRMETESDCEVLVHLYARDGLRFLDNVRGMYAVVLWDRPRHRLVLARDRFGIKPLYYVVVGDVVLFASELKALFEHPSCPGELDWERALADQSMNVAPYLTDEPVTTWFRGIKIVPAGTIVTIDLHTGRTDHHEYWSLPGFDGQSDATDAQFVSGYRELLAESVTDCATADAELGLFLSGGIDSAAVAAFASRLPATVHTFSVLSGSTVANGDAEFGHRVAGTLGMPNHQVLFDADRTPRVDEWKQLLWLLETPLCGAEQYYKYELHRHAKQARPELRGMLLGQASDEYNGGYSTVLTEDNDWVGFEASVLQMARRAALLDTPTLSPWWNHSEGLLLTDEPLRSTAEQVLSDPYTAYIRWKHRCIQQYNCWHEDRTAAGNGVEARVPFLDHRIVELLATIPADRRRTLLWDKRILRDALRGLLPDDVVERPKVPFFYGEGVGFTYRALVRMLAQDGDALLEEALASPGGQRYLRPAAMRGMLRRLEHEVEPFDVEFLLRLVNLGLLDQMARCRPAVPLDAPRYEVLPCLPVTDWARDVAGTISGMRRFPEPSADDLIALNPDVLLVVSPADPGTIYLAVNGQFEFVVSERDDPAWCALLREVDGSRTLAELLADSGVSMPEVATTLRQAIDAGVLVAVHTSAGKGEQPARDQMVETR